MCRESGILRGGKELRVLPGDREGEGVRVREAETCSFPVKYSFSSAPSREITTMPFWRTVRLSTVSVPSAVGLIHRVDPLEGAVVPILSDPARKSGPRRC